MKAQHRKKRAFVPALGNLVLVGSNLPHDWISDVGDGEHITNRDVVFQFHPEWIRDCQLPELRAVDPPFLIAPPAGSSSPD